MFSISMRITKKQNSASSKLIRANKPLPPNLRTESAGTHFYRYGLMFFKDNKVKQKFYYNPYFILFMELLYYTRSLVSLYVPESNRQYFVYSGDYMYFIGAKTHINIASTQYMMLGICILLMNYFNYCHNIKPDFLKPFDFLSGKVTPANVGLHNSVYIYDIAKKAHRAIKVTELNTKLVFVVSFILSFLPLAIRLNLQETILYGIPWSLIFAISSYYTFSAYFWNITYFYILCHLIKYQIRETRETAKYMLQFARIKTWHLILLQKRYVKIVKQVKRYDQTYWSKYLLICIILLSTFNNTVFYTALFADMHIVVRVSLFYATSLSTSAIVFVLKTASLVHHESTLTWTVFYHASVNTFSNASNNWSNRFVLKISTLIENLSRPFGFYFLNLFIISYFRFYEISSLIIGYFLKIVELSRSDH